MPIVKTANVVTYSTGHDNDRTALTDVHPSDNFAVCDAKDPLKQVAFDCSGLTTNTTATISAPASGTYTLPPVAGTLSGAAQVLQYAAPATGATVTVAAATQSLVLNPAADISELTIALPTTPADGKLVRVSSAQAVTTLTITDGAASGVGYPTAMTDNSFFALIYREADTTWYRHG